uniref:Uncharacterized protein n=1 Tax=Rhizophora mucronata TaxID=61149 RepID=A0A2P2QY22_RHIMU
MEQFAFWIRRTKNQQKKKLKLFYLSFMTLILPLFSFQRFTCPHQINRGKIR